MDATLTATIAIITGAISATITHFLQINIEKRKVSINRKETEIKEFKLEIAQAIKIMMNFCHQMCWVTWHANKLKGKTPNSIYDEYNLSAHKFLADLTEKLAVIGATDSETYKKVHQIGVKLIDLDAEIGEVIINNTIEKGTNFEKFAKLSVEASKLERELPNYFLELLSLAERNLNKRKN